MKQGDPTPHEGVNIFKTSEEIETELEVYSGGRMSAEAKGALAR